MISQAHLPVLLKEVVDYLSRGKADVTDILDLTFGRGGHTKAFLEKFPAAHIIGVDQDEAAEKFARDNFSHIANFKFLRGNFSQLRTWVQTSQIANSLDIILMDLGVSSPQLDNGDRGFSFYADGPLDMRMDQSQSLTAANLVNQLSAVDLKEIFISYGEAREASRVSEAIVENRTTPFQTTQQLAKLIEKVVGWRTKGVHPATQYFMALRIAVNREFENIHKAIPMAIEMLKPGGRLGIISFHSLEDRLVKETFMDNFHLGAMNPKSVIKPTRAETVANPRSRSSLFRVFEKGLPSVREKKQKYPQGPKTK